MLAGFGGAIGTMMRYVIYVLFKPSLFPYSTLLINVAGSLIIGLVFGFALRHIHFDNNWKVFLATGICGGFTTFSAFSLENFQLLQQQRFFLSAVYIITSIVAGIIATWIGYKITAN